MLHKVLPSDTDLNITVNDTFHYCYSPGGVAPLEKLLLVLPGSGASPSGVVDFLTTAANMGFNVFGAAYVNEKTPGVSCGSVPAPTNVYLDNFCYEVLFGVNLSPLASVNYANCVENRLVKGLQYLHAQFPGEGWNLFYSGLDVIWDKVTVAGHSQGGDHAAFLGKYKSVGRVICGSSPREICTQYQTTWGTFETPLSKYYFFTHVLDKLPGQMQTIFNMGVTAAPVDVEIVTDPALWGNFLITSYPVTGTPAQMESKAHKDTFTNVAHIPVWQKLFNG